MRPPHQITTLYKNISAGSTLVTCLVYLPFVMKTSNFPIKTVIWTTLVSGWHKISLFDYFTTLLAVLLLILQKQNQTTNWRTDEQRSKGNRLLIEMSILSWERVCVFKAQETLRRSASNWKDTGRWSGEAHATDIVDSQWLLELNGSESPNFSYSISTNKKHTKLHARLHADFLSQNKAHEN